VPYLPIDPRDLGRSYESVIRVNSQSGKGGVAYLIERDYDLTMPRRLQVEFSSVVQNHTDDSGKEVSAAEIWNLFEAEYLDPAGPVRYQGHKLFDADDRQGIRVRLDEAEGERTVDGVGNGPIDALLDAIGASVRVQHYEEHSMGQGSDARAVAFVELSADGLGGDVYGVGMDSNIVTASIKAIVSGVNRVWARLPESAREGFFSAGEAKRYA
jgi:2-isopropylmalate synthase